MKNRPDRYSALRGLIRMSWSKENLYNLANRQRYPDLSRRTLFQQMWIAKRETRAYHGDHITERQFIKAWKSVPLPVFGLTSTTHTTSNDKSMPPKKLPPMQTLTYSPLERRVDVALFRACFFPSVYAAKQAVTAGKVSVNNIVCKQPSYLLKDGDMFSVDPNAIPMLKPYSEDVPGTDSEMKSAAPEDPSTTNPQPPKRNPAARGLKFTPYPYQQPWTFVPEYLEISYLTCSGVFVRAPMVKPGKCEVPSPYPPEVHGLAHEYYSKRG